MIGSGFERRSESSGGPDAPVAGPRLRVYELAKELGISNRDMVMRLQGLGIDAVNHMSHLEGVDVDRVRRSLTRERHESLVEERLTDTVIRRRSKVPPPVVAAPVPAVSLPSRKATPQAEAKAAPAVESPPAPRPSSKGSCYPGRTTTMRSCSDRRSRTRLSASRNTP